MRIFDNPGNKIKKTISVIFIVFIVFFALISLLIWIGIGFDEGGIEGFFGGLFAALLFFAICGFLTWYSLILISAFGDIVNEEQKQTKLLERIAAQLEKPSDHI